MKTSELERYPLKLVRTALLAVLAAGSLASAQPVAPPATHAAAARTATHATPLHLKARGSVNLKSLVAGPAHAAQALTAETLPLKLQQRLAQIRSMHPTHAARAGVASPAIADFQTVVDPNVPVPFPAGPSAISSFDGLDHRDQRFGTDNRFSLEPPDQALCVGNGYVVEGVNNAFRVFSKSGTALTPIVSINDFFNAGAELLNGSNSFSDPTCIYDSDTGRFFFEEWSSDSVHHTSAINIAVSDSGDPTGTWTLFSFDTTNPGDNADCPCIPDFVHMATNADALILTSNEFGFVDGFNGTNLYALSKSELVSAASTVDGVAYYGLTDADGNPAYHVWPAYTEPGSALSDIAYLESSMTFNNADNRLQVWALLGTSHIVDNPDAVTLVNGVIHTRPYLFPPFNGDVQKNNNALRPYGYGFLGVPDAPRLNPNTDAIMQVSQYHGVLYSALNTGISDPTTDTTSAVEYFIFRPILPVLRDASPDVTGTMLGNDYVAVAGESVLYPSIVISTTPRPSRRAPAPIYMGVTLVGPDYYPSAAITRLLPALQRNVPLVITGPGAGPDDGFTGYNTQPDGSGRLCAPTSDFPTANTRQEPGCYAAAGRWGDYSAAAVDDADGSLWFGNEYITSRPRSKFANWGTRITHVTP